MTASMGNGPRDSDQFQFGSTTQADTSGTFPEPAPTVIKKLVVLFSFIITAIILYFLTIKYPNIFFFKGFYTFLALAIIYGSFKVGLEETAVKKIKESRARYSFKKVISVLYVIIFLIVLATIWIENPESLLVAYGLAAAGIAISLQDIFKNVAGGIIILVNRLFSVGDRIEIGSVIGDVIDVGIQYTTLLEIRGWVEGDQATGRLTILPNGLVLSNVVNNYTKDHSFIWDEMVLPITYDSNWQEAAAKIIEIIKNETKHIIKQSEKEITRLEEKYYLTKRPTEPAIFLRMTDNWIQMHLRYITETRQRRIIHDKLSRLILKEIEASPNIKLASATFDIVGFPELRLKEK